MLSIHQTFINFCESLLIPSRFSVKFCSLNCFGNGLNSKPPNCSLLLLCYFCLQSTKDLHQVGRSHQKTFFNLIILLVHSLVECNIFSAIDNTLCYITYYDKKFMSIYIFHCSLFDGLLMESKNSLERCALNI